MDSLNHVNGTNLEAWCFAGAITKLTSWTIAQIATVSAG